MWEFLDCEILFYLRDPFKGIVSREFGFFLVGRQTVKNKRIIELPTRQQTTEDSKYGRPRACKSQVAGVSSIRSAKLTELQEYPSLAKAGPGGKALTTRQQWLNETYHKNCCGSGSGGSVINLPHGSASIISELGIQIRFQVQYFKFFYYLLRKCPGRIMIVSRPDL